jgi:hypothetical protein
MAVKKKVAKKKLAKKKTTTKKTSNNVDLCFTIMPFGGWFDDYYSSIYCPAIENAGLNPCRADDLYRPSTIVHDIWSYTQKAKIILADLTGKNANVFYELGLAHALAKPAILVVENMDDVPFDLRALRVIEYDKNSPNWGEVLKEKIEASIREVMEAPAQSVLPAFLDVKEGSKKTSVTEREKELIEMRQDIEMMRREFTLPRHKRVRDEIDPTTARDMIRRYVEEGMPRSMIVRRLEDLGPPERWIISQISEIQSELEAESTTPSTKQKTTPRKVTPRKKIFATKRSSPKSSNN